ncbi:hypothetical protein FOC1_g10009220 [Fusarium oxysporum f. sp. cubense race 1]|uniref:Uncharacterized protein n=1 Tax=Fusarium oxysporum f. sp. cubense (strain race 1) TaxID=1229664 RepID=N4U029_FUSC1|nr:hypothetical protein FOC1_g10009220 [Fusarium oxysporum f. sp. cubense race 1]
MDLHSAASTSLQSPMVSGLAGPRAKHGQYHSTVFSKDQRSTKRSPSFETSNHCLSLSLSRNAQSKTVTFQRLYKGVGIVLEETWKKSGSRL